MTRAKRVDAASGSSGARVGRLASDLREREIDVLLVANQVNVRYLTGFTGTNGLALIVAHPARRHGHRFFTDFRYATQSVAQVPDAFEREIVAGEMLEGLVDVLTSSSEGDGRLGFDDASVTVKQHARLVELLGEEWELVPCAGAVERLRAVKDAGEIDRIRAATRLADEALRETLEAGVVGRTERDVAIELELRMRRLGAEGPSFPSIVAAGASAMRGGKYVYVRVRDIVCVVLGLDVPLVLRLIRMDKVMKAPIYKLVGWCYCHGIMMGEAVESGEFETFIIQ